MDIRRSVVSAAVVALMVILIVVAWRMRSPGKVAGADTTDRATAAPANVSSVASVGAARTTVYAHNLELRKGPQFRIYVRWLRGEMETTRPGVPPSLDSEDSFVFHIDRGLVHANLGDLETYLNSKMAPRSPLSHITLRGEGDQVKLSGTLRKVLPLPVEVVGTISPAPNGRVHVHVNKINVLKVPMKGLLGGLSVEVSDVVGSTPVPGIEVKDNDIYLDPTKLLPPPHIRGQISSVTLQAPDVVVTYGSTEPDDEKELAQWHNFLRLRGGKVRFGNLVMEPADLTLIDASNDVWFDLDLANYRQQLVKGYSRMTPDNGLEMYLPDVGKGMPSGAISLDTLRDRKRPLPQPEK
jgi:Domain of unknown function (DUF811).